ncbi:MAG: hypothetical protein AB7G47_10640 [Mycolicibacterium sp.]|uniref:hypothetical protein n=1 Tax=Mycolicibacterium sp. TaxID=2320850 RepID=UPI003D0B56D1
MTTADGWPATVLAGLGACWCRRRRDTAGGCPQTTTDKHTMLSAPAPGNTPQTVSLVGALCVLRWPTLMGARLRMVDNG